MKSLKVFLSFFVLSLSIVLLTPNNKTLAAESGSFSYESPKYYEVGKEITSLSPTISGNGYSFSISPTLPNGLSISTSTGVISGTPYALSLAKTYTVTATNEQGSQTFNLTLASLTKPVSFNYTDPIRFFTINRLVTDTLISSTEPAGVAYSTSPELPDGLHINPATGEIGGFATEISELTSYIVTASNPLGTATTSVSIAVPMPWTGVGSPVTTSNASSPFMNLIYINNIYIPYVIYSNLSNSSIVVAKYNTSSDSWAQVGNTINNVKGNQNKIIFDANNNPYISYISNGGLFISKYNKQNNLWESLDTANNQESVSSLSNAATNHDTITNASNNAYEAYVEGGSLNIVKLINNPTEYSSIDNLGEETAISNFSYATSSVVFGTGSKINPLYPLISGPASFSVYPNLPPGLSIYSSGSEAGVIYGTPILASDETVYTVTAKNNINTATTSIKIKVAGPWKELTAELVTNNTLSRGIVAQSSNNDLYLSYFSNVSNTITTKGKGYISKYNSTTSSWETLYSCNQTTMDESKGIMDFDIVMAMTTKENDLYAVFSKDFIDFSNQENPSFSSTLYVKKYNASTATWTTLGEIKDSGIDPVINSGDLKIAFAGNDLFLAYYADRRISIYKFDEAGNSFGNSTIADFVPSRSYDLDNNNPDNNLFIGNGNKLYLAYSDDTASSSVVLKVIEQATTTTGWLVSTYVDTEPATGLSAQTKLAVDDLKIGNDGKLYISYHYSGNYLTAEEGVTNSVNRSIIKEFNPTLGTFTEIFSEDSHNENITKNILSFDKDGILWSSSGASSESGGYTFKKYSGGAWSNMLGDKHFGGEFTDVKYPELLFGPNEETYAFINRDATFSLAKYDGAEAPINYDYSLAPTISYPKESFTYVTGRKIDPLYPAITGSSKEKNTVVDENHSILPSGLSVSHGIIYGTPLAATTTTLKMTVANDSGQNYTDITLNIIDPWVSLGNPLSTSTEAISLGVDSYSKLYIAYSKASSSINEILVSKYDNETWQTIGGKVSDDGISASNPKISTRLSNLYVAYREDSSKKLIVKEYNSQTGAWSQLGGAVSDYSSDTFNIDINSGYISVIYYDDINDRSVLKAYINGNWVIKGGYIENGLYPSLYTKSAGDYDVSTAYLNSDGAVKVVNYKEINYSGSGKDVPLSEVSGLIESGDMSPQGGGTATSTPAIKFNQKLNIIPFTGASVLIPSGTVMTATELFNSSLLSASSTVNLNGINSSFTPAGVIMFGLPNLGLSLSSPITISIPISGLAENTLLQVYSKTAGGNWSSLTTCYVVAGKCSFQTSHLSEFAAGTIATSNNSGSNNGGGSSSNSSPAATTCTSVIYSNFSNVCSDGYLIRGISTKLPNNCTLSAAQIEASKKACTISVGEESEITTSTATSTITSSTGNALKEIRNKFVALEKSLIKKINKLLTKRLLGHILLQVENHGEAWYLDPVSSARYYLADGESAYTALRQFGLGITNADITKIPVGSYSYTGDVDTDSDGLSDKIENGLGTNPNLADTDKDGVGDGEEILKKNTNPLNSKKLTYSNSLIKRIKGRIVIQTEKKGEAWYINPADGKRYYLADGPMAYQVMRYLSLGITNANIRQLKIWGLK